MVVDDGQAVQLEENTSQAGDQMVSFFSLQVEPVSPSGARRVPVNGNGARVGGRRRCRWRSQQREQHLLQ